MEIYKAFYRDNSSELIQGADWADVLFFLQTRQSMFFPLSDLIKIELASNQETKDFTTI